MRGAQKAVRNARRQALWRDASPTYKRWKKKQMRRAHRSIDRETILECLDDAAETQRALEAEDAAFEREIAESAAWWDEYQGQEYVGRSDDYDIYDDYEPGDDFDDYYRDMLSPNAQAWELRRQLRTARSATVRVRNALINGDIPEQRDLEQLYNSLMDLEIAE